MPSAVTDAKRGSPSSRWLIALLSAVAVAAVVVVTYGLPERSGREAASGVLPSVSATLNGLAAAVLSAGYLLIRRRREAAHKACMLTACGLSLAFVATYLLHHSRIGSVPFEGRGVVRAVYFAFLVPHVLLAAAVVPLVLTTVHRALTGRRDQHVRVARWTLPVWLFVSVSGVVVYAMLYHL